MTGTAQHALCQHTADTAAFKTTQLSHDVHMHHDKEAPHA